MTDNENSAALVDKSPLATYQGFLGEGKLAYQWDPSNGRAVFFPRLIGPKSGNPQLEWRISRGLGTVYATTMIHQRGEPPYNVSLVDVDEGFRMMTRVHAPEGQPVAIGMRVAMRTFDPGEGVPPYPVFEVTP